MDMIIKKDDLKDFSLELKKDFIIGLFQRGPPRLI
jgi:hypothetical protein